MPLSRYLTLFSTVMRVPPLLVMDSILNQTFLASMYLEIVDEEAPWYNIWYIGWIFLQFSCLIWCFIMFTMSMEQLIHTYTFFLSSGLVLVSYIWNRNMVQNLSEISIADLQNEWVTFLRSIGLNIIIQCGLAYNFNNLRLDQPWLHYDVYTNFVANSLSSLTYFSFMFPTVSKLVAIPDLMLNKTPIIAVFFPLGEIQAFIFSKLKKLHKTFVEIYNFNKMLIQNFGIQGYIENQWLRLCVPDVLRIFWITKFTYQVIFGLRAYFSENQINFGSYFITLQNLTIIGRDLLVDGCDTTVSLSGMTSMISYITQFIGLGFAVFIGSEKEEGRNMGTVSAILFFILALQTGLTRLDSDQRLTRLYRNLCLLSTAILHFVHSMVNPILMQLSASRTGSTSKHARVLFMCVFLIVFPSCFLYYLWTTHTISTWLLAVSAFSLEVIIKVMISLLQYILFTIDAYRETFWEQLDDYIYYVRSTGNTIEFLFGIFLFCNGGWIMIFESGGTIRAIMMCIHAYFNIWVQAKEGWKTFMRHRSAVHKINSLPFASQERLDRHDDVCAICYQELEIARMTRCNHLFHGVCLRKWLYVTDTCPLCHEVIYVQNDSTTDSQQEPEVNGGFQEQEIRQRRRHNSDHAAVNHFVNDDDDDDGDWI